MIGHVPPCCFALYASGFCWTIVYDTIYALQDIKDDKMSGIKSTAILFGDNVKTILSGFATTSVALFILAGTLNNAGLFYYLISCVGSAAHYYWQISYLEKNCTADAWKKFKSNQNLGIIVAIGMGIDRLVSFLY